MSANKKSAQTHVFIAFVTLITIPTANSGLNDTVAYCMIKNIKV